ncbi:MAG: imidazole glycerol phosphate synthase, glutamine amidotransferase subunit [Omnitrophica WOR_2 bacterium RIFCSPHIGHO2_02_FULL_67_20]|nr:MAG: imidazole glycerol phosphate synthase, glutamine amidotransferase subunit [Omnitrophica WOR_2 bacterium RIFCSPHIGHO2_02_FULL_67_20]
MIVVIDYGMGNLRSVSKALESLGASVRVSGNPAEVSRADKVILPGVGAFPAAMRELSARKLVEPIKAALAKGTPYLGICLGLQLLFETSEEGEGGRGFGVLPGTVRRFAMNGSALKVPHMGWNQISSPEPRAPSPEPRCPLLNGISDGSFVYFVHSYYAEPKDPSVTTLETDYGGRFASMVWRGNLYATQFHPEKSQAIGLKLLKNFIEL